MHEVTRILDAMEAGDDEAAAGLLPAAYDELRRMAANKMAGERGGDQVRATMNESQLMIETEAPSE